MSDLKSDLPPPTGSLPPSYLYPPDMSLLRQPVPSAAQPSAGPGTSTMPIAAPPELYAPGTAGYNANRHFGPGATGFQSGTTAPPAVPPSDAGTDTGEPQPPAATSAAAAAAKGQPLPAADAPVERITARDPTGRNNPGNIRPPGSSGGFESYPTMEAGIQAIRGNLLSYQDQHGLNTVRGIVTRWAPPNENPTEQLIANASQRTGFAPDQPIDLHDPDTMKKMTDAIITQEQGGGSSGPPSAKITAGMTEAGKARFAAVNEEYNTIKQALDGILKKMNETDPGDPEYRALLRQHREYSQQLEQAYLNQAFHAPQRTRQDIMGQFGSLAMLAGVLGGFGARVPAIASLNAAGAAMEAMNANNERDYRNQMEVWKLQTGALEHAMTMENDQIKDILEEKNTSLREKHEALRDAFTMLGMEKQLADLRIGNYDAIIQDQQTREKLADEHKHVMAQIDELEEKAATSRAEREWGMPGVKGEAGMLIRNQLTRMAQERNPNAKPEEISGLARELAKDPKTMNDAVQQAYAIQHPEAGGLQTQLLNQLDRERQAEGKPPMTAQEKWDLLQAEKPLSPSQIHDQERAAKVVATLDLGNDTIAMIQHSVAVVGLSGRLRGPLETIGNILGATEETIRRQIESNIRQLQQEFAEETSGRNIYTRQQAEFQDQIIRGLSSGSTVQNTIKTIQNMQDHVAQIYRPQLKRWGYLESDNPPPGLRGAAETQWPADPAKAGLKEGDTATDPQSGVTRTVKGGKWDPPL